MEVLGVNRLKEVVASSDPDFPVSNLFNPLPDIFWQRTIVGGFFEMWAYFEFPTWPSITFIDTIFISRLTQSVTYYVYNRSLVLVKSGNLIVTDQNGQDFWIDVPTESGWFPDRIKFIIGGQFTGTIRMSTIWGSQVGEKQVFECGADFDYRDKSLIEDLWEPDGGKHIVPGVKKWLVSVPTVPSPLVLETGEPKLVRLAKDNSPYPVPIRFSGGGYKFPIYGYLKASGSNSGPDLATCRADIEEA